MSEFQEPKVSEPPATETKLLPKWIGILVAVWFLFAGLPTFSEIIQYQYFPDPNWLDRISVVRWGSGIVTAAVLAFVIWKAKDKYAGKPLRHAVMICFALVFGFSLGRDAVTASAPMVVAILVGDQVEIPFSVVDAESWGDRKCRNPIELDLPLLFNKLCRYTESFRATLRPGDTLILMGRGTRFGVFATSAKKLKQTMIDGP